MATLSKQEVINFAIPLLVKGIGAGAYDLDDLHLIWELQSYVSYDEDSKSQS